MGDILPNLLSPMVLCFLLGIVAELVKSGLEIPSSFIKGISIYLMFSIGLQGGSKLYSVGCSTDIALPILAASLLSFSIPFLCFAFLRSTTSLNNDNAAAVSAHYGSISIITFAVSLEFLNTYNICAEEFMVTIAAVMETPAIIAGLILKHKYSEETSSLSVLKKVFFHNSIFLLLGGFAIGYVVGPAIGSVKPFFFDMFKGFLCIFLMDMGISVARHFHSLENMDWRVLSFSIYMPIINACIGTIVACNLLNLSLGGVVVFSALCASASYIAVPAAMRLAIPNANPALYMTLSLGITFPFNILAGIPYYLKLAQFWKGF